MGGVQPLLDALTRSGIEEGLRLAYAVTRLLPAGLVVGSAAILAGVLGAAAMRKARAARPRPRETSRAASVPWVLGAGMLALVVGPARVEANVLCRKGHSAHLVVRAAACRSHEHQVEPDELNVGTSAACVENVALAWDRVDALGAQLEAARDLAARAAAQPWDGAATWLALQGAQITLTLADLEKAADALGVADAATPIAAIRGLVTDDWGRPLEACDAALALVPLLEAMLPRPPAA